jgi:hypothetical protein
LGSTILNPPPVGIVEFAGGTSAGCSGVFVALKGFATAACKLVAPSKCTVFIQNSLLVDWLGLTITGLVGSIVIAPDADAAVVLLVDWLGLVGSIVIAPDAFAAVVLFAWASACCDICVCIPRIKEADTITATIAVAVMIAFVVFIFLLLFIFS